MGICVQITPPLSFYTMGAWLRFNIERGGASLQQQHSQTKSLQSERVVPAWATCFIFVMQPSVGVCV